MSDEIRIFVSRQFDELGDAFFKVLNEQVAPRLSARMQKGPNSHDVDVKFADARHAEGGTPFTDKVIKGIKKSRLFLAVCLPGATSRVRRVASWISAEIGFAYAYRKPMQAIWREPVDPNADLTFVTAEEAREAFEIKAQDFTLNEKGKPLLAPGFVQRLTGWLEGWIQSRLADKAISISDYLHRKYVKDVTVFPDGYGRARIRILVEVLKAVRTISHQFGVQREDEDPIPNLDELRTNFEGMQMGANGRLDVFHFECIHSDGPGLIASAPPTERTHDGAGLPPMYPNHRRFYVSNEDRSLIAEGDHRYEFAYGLKSMFTPGFGPDTTLIRLRPAVVLDGTLVIRFRHDRDSSKKLRRRELRLVRMREGHPDETIPVKPVVQTNAVETSHVFKSLFSPEDASSQIRCEW